MTSVLLIGHGRRRHRRGLVLDERAVDAEGRRCRRACRRRVPARQRSSAYAAARAEAKKNGYISGGSVSVTPQSGQPQLAPSCTSPSRARCRPTSHRSSARSRAARDRSSETSAARPSSRCPCPWAARRTTTASARTSTTRSTRTQQQQLQHRLAAGGRRRQRRLLDQPDKRCDSEQHLHDRAPRTAARSSGTRSVFRRARRRARTTRRSSSTASRSSSTASTSAASATSTNCYVKTEVSWNGGTTWSHGPEHERAEHDDHDRSRRWAATRSTSRGARNVGVHRLQQHELPRPPDVAQRHGQAGCASARSVALDQLDVRVTYHTVTTTTTYTQQTPARVTIADERHARPARASGAPSSPGRQPRERRPVQPGQRQLGHQRPHVHQPRVHRRRLRLHRRSCPAAVAR